MLCQKCQATIPEGEMFCPMCGALAVPVEAPATETPVAEVPAPQEDVPMNEVPMQEAPMNEEQVPPEAWAPAPEEPVKKPKPIGWIVAAVIAVVAIVAAVVVLFMMNGNKTLQDTWKVSVHLDKMVEIAEQEDLSAMEMLYPGVDIDTMLELYRVEEPLSVYVTFREDDSCAMYLNLPETEAFVVEFYDRVLTWMQNGGYYQIMEMQGYSRAEVDEMLAEMGMDMNTLLLMMGMGKSQVNAAGMEATFAQLGLKTDDSGNVKLFETSYRYEDGKLSFAPFLGGDVEETWSVKATVNGDTLDLDFDLGEDFEKVREMFNIERAALPQ